MRVIRATVMGMCFGVRDALRIAREHPRPLGVTVFGDLVHNEEVRGELDRRGFSRLGEHERGVVPSTPEVLVTAHGISESARGELLAAGKELVDTTCPLVRHVQEVARALEREGYHVVVIGNPRHVEVAGIVGDLREFTVVRSPDEVDEYRARRLGVLCQSTTRPALACAVLAQIRRRNPTADVRYEDTICAPTRDRQRAVETLLEGVEALVVVGGRDSNNTRQLLALAEARGVPGLHIQSAAQLCPAWFDAFETVGLTAGTSTLDETVEEVYQALAAM